MPSKRISVDLSGFPDLVVVYLGMQVTAWRGLRTMFGIGPQISRSVATKPDGLLLHEGLMFGLRHVGMRQYWRDLASLEAFTRSDPHRAWWRDFLKDAGGTGFWHETYRMQGGMEAIYIAMPTPVGFGRFAPPSTPEGSRMTARLRLDGIPKASA